MNKKFNKLLISVFLFIYSLQIFSIQLPLPPSLIAFSSSKGIKIFNQTLEKRDFWLLSQYFVTEKNQAFCSIASLTMVLNATNIPRPVTKPFAPFSFFSQSNIFNKKILNYIYLQQINRAGLTLDQLKQITIQFPLNVTAIHASSRLNDLKTFRTQARNAINSGQKFIIINFSRKSLNQVGGGHFSPLAAYDKNTDRFLLMDVARYKYPPFWIKTTALWQAMNTIDPESKKTRGYLVISKAWFKNKIDFN